jgi:hypothetical protein
MNRVPPECKPSTLPDDDDDDDEDDDNDDNNNNSNSINSYSLTRPVTSQVANYSKSTSLKHKRTHAG